MEQKFDEIHIWEFTLSDISINLESKFRASLFKEATKKFKTSKELALFLCGQGKKYGVIRTGLASRIRYWKNNTKLFFIPAWIIFEVTNALEIPKEVVEDKIISYKTYHGSTNVVNPRLPILITPEFAALVANLMGDGTDKRSLTPLGSYTQYNPISRGRFYKKILNVFGNLVPPTLSSDGKQVVLPSCLFLALKNYYKIKSFGSFESRIPQMLKNSPKEFRIAILSAFLVDEGSIYDNIILRVKNRELLSDLREIALSLGYNCSEIAYTKDKKFGGYVFKFSISTFSAKKLLDDIKKLTESFPTCDLAHKQENLEHLVSLSRISGSKRKMGKTKEIIFECLKEPKTVMEISKIVGIGRRTIRQHLGDMIKINKVMCCGTKGRAKLWSKCEKYGTTI